MMDVWGCSEPDTWVDRVMMYFAAALFFLCVLIGLPAMLLLALIGCF